MKASWMSWASRGLSITKPSSVFNSAERGSKLNDPTKTRLSSMVSVLACRLEPELPKGPGPEPSFPPNPNPEPGPGPEPEPDPDPEGSLPDAPVEESSGSLSGRVSYSLMPAFNSGLRHFA